MKNFLYALTLSTALTTSFAAARQQIEHPNMAQGLHTSLMNLVAESGVAIPEGASVFGVIIKALKAQRELDAVRECVAEALPDSADQPDQPFGEILGSVLEQFKEMAAILEELKSTVVDHGLFHEDDGVYLKNEDMLPNDGETSLGHAFRVCAKLSDAIKTDKEIPLD